MKIVYAIQAQQDLKNIYEYIAQVLLAPDTAAGMYRKLIQGARSLATMPERNPLYKDEPWHSLGVRFLSIKNYMLLYKVDSEAETVTISRILYGGMDIGRQLEDSEEI